jgi:hypothetical protein
VKVSELFKNALSFPQHETLDLHYIGEALPAPSNPAAVLSLGTPAHPGGSPVPAREDHVHALDLDEIVEALIDAGEITVDLSNYYTMAETDTLLAAIVAMFDDYYTITEIDLLLGAISGGGPSSYVWSYPGIVAPVTDEVLGYYIAQQAMTITKIVLTLTENASTNYVVAIYIDGVFADSATLVAPAIVHEEVVSIAVADGETISCVIDDQVTGDGAGLIVEAIL